MRISVLLGAVIGIAVVVGVWGGLGRQAQGGMYTVSLHTIKDPMNPTPVALANSKGMTLYFNSSDTPTRSSCTGDCAKIWPPLLSDGKPTKDPATVAGTKIDGEVSAVNTANGSQVAYNGHLLYSYTGDAAPGEAMGAGKGGKWYVATPLLPKW